MKIIKLNAIDSTNSFLKELAQNSTTEDFTIVVAEKQVSGRGQINNSWYSEPYKNLTFSILKQLKNLKIQEQPYLNFGVSLAIFDVLKTLGLPNLKIKWPNDIMSGNRKICGILIETTLANKRIKNAVIGIGLNVNQQKFPSHLKNASSLKMILNKDFDLDKLLQNLVEKIQSQLAYLEKGKFEAIHQNYLEHLYKKEIPTAFKNEKNQLFFMGIIKGVTKNGNLQIQLEDGSIARFGVKEISLAKV